MEKKAIIDHFKAIKDDKIRRSLLAAYDERYEEQNGPQLHLYQAIRNGFDWTTTVEDREYWKNLYNKAYNHERESRRKPELKEPTRVSSPESKSVKTPENDSSNFESEVRELWRGVYISSRGLNTPVHPEFYANEAVEIYRKTFADNGA